MKLEKVALGQSHFIESIDLISQDSLGIRLLHLGFHINEEIIVLKKTPLTHDALLVAVRGTQIALTKAEASLIRLKTEY